ncbi:uncharacterized protein LOC112503220 isoform X2 [Cynara cardunculus var. scolymus]|uniref:uncharacterized protein LOC112503220 isoform X2 n=1 Tax=Cynara cardunculus var. scolymus TaxID=59895 RepID=UPI000D626827|nr:uncharacterized protein LOC112503220 isoform X2 [Cynara cardunculus var. scolymus]
MSGANCKEVDPRKEEEEEEEEEEMVTGMGSYKGKVRMVRGDPSDEMMLLWGLQQPTFSKPNAFVSQSSLNLTLDACGRRLSISQSPSSLIIVQFSFTGTISSYKYFAYYLVCSVYVLQCRALLELLDQSCGIVELFWGNFWRMRWKQDYLVFKARSCIAALLGAQVILTDMPDRLRLLKKNIEDNMYGDVRGCATANELTWGDRPEPELVEPLPDFVIGSDVIYSEEAVTDLLDTLVELSGINTTIILAGELRNDAILEYFLEAAMEEFMIGRVDQAGWHPDYRSPRVAMYVLVMK